jgi:hypothetical protein
MLQANEQKPTKATKVEKPETSTSSWLTSCLFLDAASSRSQEPDLLVLVLVLVIPDRVRVRFNPLSRSLQFANNGNVWSFSTSRSIAFYWEVSAFRVRDPLGGA